MAKGKKRETPRYPQGRKVETSEFLPTTRAEMRARGWDQCDFVFVSGDAYVDHPSFGPAIISRVLEANGYKVGMIAQPDWRDPASVSVLGEPRLAFLVSSGNTSPIGAIQPAFRSWASPGLRFWFRAATWTPWSTTIRWPSIGVPRTSTRLAERWGFDPTMPPWYTATSFDARISTRP